MKIDTANVYFDHPYHSTLDHVLAIDFTNEGEGGRDRVAVELSADSARALIDRILAALASGEAAHAIPAPAVSGRRGINDKQELEDGHALQRMSLATHESVSAKASGAARLDVVPLTKHIGAEIRGIDLREKPDEATVQGDLSGLARPPGADLSGAKTLPGRSDPRHEASSASRAS